MKRTDLQPEHVIMGHNDYRVQYSTFWHLFNMFNRLYNHPHLEVTNQSLESCHPYQLSSHGWWKSTASMAENSDADKPQKLVLQGEALKINPGGIPNNKVWSKMWQQLPPGLTRNLLPHSVTATFHQNLPARTTKLSTGPTPNRQGPKLSPEPRCNLQRFPEPARNPHRKFHRSLSGLRPLS